MDINLLRGGTRSPRTKLSPDVTGIPDRDKEGHPTKYRETINRANA
jgi:hypothetical protein